MGNPILIFFSTVIAFSVALHLYYKCTECLRNGKTTIEDDTVKNC